MYQIMTKRFFSTHQHGRVNNKTYMFTEQSVIKVASSGIPDFDPAEMFLTFGLPLLSAPYSQHLIQLVHRCLAYRPPQRATARQICREAAKVIGDFDLFNARSGTDKDSVQFGKGDQPPNMSTRPRFASIPEPPPIQMAQRRVPLPSDDFWDWDMSPEDKSKPLDFNGNEALLDPNNWPWKKLGLSPIPGASDIGGTAQLWPVGNGPHNLAAARGGTNIEGRGGPAYRGAKRMPFPSGRPSPGGFRSPRRGSSRRRSASPRSPSISPWP